MWWGTYFCMGTGKQNMVVVSKIGAHIHEMLYVSNYQPDFMVLYQTHNIMSNLLNHILIWQCCFS